MASCFLYFQRENEEGEEEEEEMGEGGWWWELTDLYLMSRMAFTDGVSDAGWHTSTYTS